MDRLTSTKLTRAIRRTLAVVGMALALVFSAGSAIFAAPLDDAKAAGLIGERPDGFVAAVQPNPSPDISALVKQINNGRRAAYQDIANKTNTPIQQVGAVTAEKLRAQGRPGHYFMDAGGNWVRK